MVVADTIVRYFKGWACYLASVCYIRKNYKTERLMSNREKCDSIFTSFRRWCTFSKACKGCVFYAGLYEIFASHYTDVHFLLPMSECRDS